MTLVFSFSLAVHPSSWSHLLIPPFSMSVFFSLFPYLWDPVHRPLSASAWLTAWETGVRQAEGSQAPALGPMRPTGSSGRSKSPEPEVSFVRAAWAFVLSTTWHSDSFFQFPGASLSSPPVALALGLLHWAAVGGSCLGDPSCYYLSLLLPKVRERP